jgi:hypothetical protein
MFNTPVTSDITALKELTLAQIEDKFSKALQELTGKVYEVNINELGLNSEASSATLAITLIATSF